MAEGVGALRWYLEIDGITEGIFKEVSGLDSETEVIEHRVTGKGGNIIVHKVPGALKWPNIVLRRGLTDDRKLHDWRDKIEKGQTEANRKNGTVTLYDPSHKPVAKYMFTPRKMPRRLYLCHGSCPTPIYLTGTAATGSRPCRWELYLSAH